MSWQAKIGLVLIFTLLTSMFMSHGLYWPKAAMATTLTVYPTGTAATTVTTANTLVATSPSPETSYATKLGKKTGWGEMYSQGYVANWPGGTSAPAASGHGFLWDATTLEAQQIIAGTWTPKVRLSVNVGSITAEIHVRAYKRSSAGAYTSILDAYSTNQTINTTATSFTMNTGTTTSSATNFTTGDKLYVDVILNITANNTGSNTATCSLYENSGANESIVTPGYQATATPPSEVGGTLSATPQYNNAYVDSPMTITENFTTTTTPTNCYYTLNNWGSKTAGTWALVSGTTYSCTASGVTSTNGTALTIAMEMSNSGGTSTHSATLSRTVDSAGPTDGSLTATAASLSQINLSWTGAGDTGSGPASSNTYKLVYLQGATLPNTTCSNGTQIYLGTGTSYNHTPLNSNTQYSYRVCAYDNLSNVSTGATATATTNIAPSVVSGPTLSATSPLQLSGSYVPGSFHINSVFNDNGAAISGCQYTLNGSTWVGATKSGSGATTNCDADVTATDGSALTIQMRATNTSGTTATSSTSKTCDAAAPGGLSASSPANEASDVAVNATLQAGAASDSGSGSVQYYFQIGTDPGVTQNVQSSGWQSGTTWAPTLVHGTQYYWHVAAKDAVGNSGGYTTSVFFTTIATCIRNDASVTLLTSGGDSTATISVNAGTAAYVLTVKNNDYGDCGNTSFNLSVSDTNLTSFSSSTLSAGTTGSLTPGATYNGSVTVNARSGFTTGIQKTHVTSSADANHSAVQSQPDVTTTLNVIVWNKNVPYLIIGPDAGNVGVGGYLDYTVTVQNNDTGTGASPVQFNLSLSDDNSTAFNTSVFTSTNGQTASLTLNSGQKGNVTLRVYSKSNVAYLDQVDVTTISLTATAHTSPSPVTATTTVGNRLIHNSINISSTKWASYGGWGVPGGKYGEFNCETCHQLSYTDASGITPNIKKIKQQIITPDTAWGTLPGDNGWTTIAFDKITGGSSVQGVFGYDGWDTANGVGGTPRTTSNKICEYCHTYDATGANGVNAHPFAYGGTLGNHNNGDGSDCTICHKHKQGFTPSLGSCDGCHGAPPGYGSNEASFAAAYPGYASSHSTHYDPAAGLPTDYTASSIRSQQGYYVFDCGRCHSTNSGNHLANVDGIVDMNMPGGGTFTRGGSAANHTRGSYIFYDYNSTCSNTYCHGNFTGGSNATPTWGSSSSAACGTCHGASQATPPAGGGNSHSKHVATVALNCDMCHNGVAGWGTVQDKSKHVNLVTDWNLKTADNRIGSGGLYRGQAWGSNASVGSDYGSCSNIYCHSSVQQSGGAALSSYGGTPAWGGGSMTCGTASCHGGDSDSPGKITSGTHTKHVQTSGYNYNCTTKCHNGAGSGTNKHADYNIDISFTGGGSYSQASNTPGNGYGTCAATYCHGSAGTPGWGSSALNCDGCHKASNVAGGLSARHLKHYNSATVATSLTDATNGSSGAGYVFNCGVCHGTSSSHAQGPQSGVQAAYVAFDSTVAGGGAYTAGGSNAGPDSQGFSYTNGSCSTTYCHSQGSNVNTPYTTPNITARWTSLYPTDCTGCHNNDYASGKWMTSGSHTKHLDASNLDPLAIDCSNCHSATVSNSRTISNTANHANRQANIQFKGWNTAGTYNGSLTPAWGTPGTNFDTCSNIYCHSTAQGPDGTSAPSYASPVWGSSPSVVVWTSAAGGSCVNKCHSTPWTGTWFTSGSHEKHTGLTNQGFACNYCHSGTGAWTTLHVNGNIDVVLNTTYGGTYSQWGTAGKNPPRNGFGSCSGVSCHSNGAVTWGGTLGCNGCHAYDSAEWAGYTSWDTQGRGAHAKHINHLKTTLGVTLTPATDTFGGASYNAVCGRCHTRNSSNHRMTQTGNNVSRYINFGDGAAAVKYQFGAGAATYNGVGGTGSAVNPKTCSNVGCHMRETPDWQTY